MHAWLLKDIINLPECPLINTTEAWDHQYVQRVHAKKESDES